MVNYRLISLALTYTRDLLVEVFLDGRGNGLNH